MLINTNQLVSLVDLRNKAGDLVTKAKSGMTFYVTDKGNIMAKLSPVNDIYQQKNVFDRMDALIKKASKLKFTDNRDSTIIIREMRDQRSEYLLNRDSLK